MNIETKLKHLVTIARVSQYTGNTNFGQVITEPVYNKRQIESNLTVVAQPMWDIHLIIRLFKHLL
ncbi:hypothetical protein [Weissella viridescens]|nr:hypothetical protein [Weissella viridescens]